MNRTPQPGWRCPPPYTHWRPPTLLERIGDAFGRWWLLVLAAALAVTMGLAERAYYAKRTCALPPGARALISESIELASDLDHCTVPR